MKKRVERASPVGLLHSTPVRAFPSSPNHSPDKCYLSKGDERASVEENVPGYQIGGTVS